jgi:hypothetical protein
MNELIIKEKDLELVVKSKTLGNLETNAKTIKENVEKMLPNFKPENYSIENIKQAEEDRALLNKTSKTLNDERIAIEKEFMKPFEDFKSIIKDTTDLIKEASSKIDEIVKTKEQEEKDIKKASIQKYFNENVGSLKDLIDLPKVFNEKWLNKTYKIEDIAKEIDTNLNSIRDSLSTIESLSSKYEVELKNYYINTLDLGLTIKYDHELKENEEKLASQSRIAEIDKIKLEEKKLEETSNKIVEEKIYDPIQTVNLQIKTKESKLTALRNFLEINNIFTKNIDTGKIIVDDNDR